MAFRKQKKKKEVEEEEMEEEMEEEEPEVPEELVEAPSKKNPEGKWVVGSIAIQTERVLINPKTGKPLDVHEALAELLNRTEED